MSGLTSTVAIAAIERKWAGTVSELELVAYLDESKKPVRNRATGKVSGDAEVYVVVAAIVFRGGQDAMRNSLKGIRSTVGAPLHYAELTDRRRTHALQAVCELSGWDAYIFETAEPRPVAHRESGVRDRALRTAVCMLAGDFGVRNFTLETRATAAKQFFRLDEDDHRTLSSLLSRGEVAADTRIVHDDKSENLLALPDLVAGARTDHLANKDSTPYSLVSHRVIEVVRF